MALLLLAASLACGGNDVSPPRDSTPGAGATASVGETSPAVAAVLPKPNIVFILADDLDSAAMSHMPKLKSLIADQGAMFPNYFVNISLCCPSRATVLRGQYGHNTQITVNEAPGGGFERFHALGEERSTVATWLQAAGYRTMLAGKYLNGYPGNEGNGYVPPGWTEWYVAIDKRGYNEFNYALNENGRLMRYGTSDEEYGTDVYARKTLEFISRSKAEGKPFFVYLAPFAPHLPATPAPRHASLFADAKVPRTANYNEPDVRDKPAHIRRQPPLTAGEMALFDADYRKRIQSLQALDEAIEGIINALSANGQLANTYIFFASDNGFHSGNHRLAEGKQSPYDEDIRVPLFVRGPGIGAGTTHAEIVGNVDLAVTWAELADVKPPEFVYGRSLMSLMAAKGAAQTPWRQAFLIQHIDPSAQGGADDEEDAAGNTTGRIVGATIPDFWGLRTADYLYVEYRTGELELYDLNRDPDQLDNLAAVADASLLSRLAGLLGQLRSCAGAVCRGAETQAVR